MSVAAHEVTRDKEIALVNALFQANPDSWIPLVQRMKHLYCRDSRSATELSRMAGTEVTSFGDLSTSAGPLPDTLPRSGVVVGDSVKGKVRNSLYSFAKELSSDDTDANRSNHHFLPRIEPLQTFAQPIHFSESQCT